MASLFSHAIAAFAIGKTFKRHGAVKFFLLGMLCAVLPDADVLSFQFGIPYGSMFGHRGFTHSIVFAILLALVMVSLFYRKEKKFTGPWVGLFAYLFLCTLSHGLLDALTDGGLGVAFFSPFSNERYFFSFRPVRVSPLDAGGFFTARGWVILKSELIWIWIPSLVLVPVAGTLRAIFTRLHK